MIFEIGKDNFLVYVIFIAMEGHFSDEFFSAAEINFEDKFFGFGVSEVDGIGCMSDNFKVEVTSVDAFSFDGSEEDVEFVFVSVDELGVFAVSFFVMFKFSASE